MGDLYLDYLDFYKIDYDALNKDLLENNIKFFKPTKNSSLCDLLDNGRYQQIEKLLKIKDACYDYEVHADHFFIMYFKDEECCKSYTHPNLTEISYQEYGKSRPSHYAIYGKTHMMGKSFYQWILDKHTLLPLYIRKNNTEKSNS